MVFLLVGVLEVLSFVYTHWPTRLLKIIVKGSILETYLFFKANDIALGNDCAHSLRLSSEMGDNICVYLINDNVPSR